MKSRTRAREWIKRAVLPRLGKKPIMFLKQAEVLIRCYWLDHYYEDDEFLILDLLMTAGREGCAIDVGSNQGQYTLALAKLGACRRVLSIEPQRDLATQLDRVARLLRLNNVVVVSCLVADQDRLAYMAGVERKHWGSQERYMVDVEPTGASEVYQVRTLDCLVDQTIASDENVVFVKMDVEGAEVRVLRGAQKLISGRRPVILAELIADNLARYGNSFADIEKFAAENNYGIWRGASGRIVPARLGEDQRSATDNYFFLPAELAELALSVNAGTRSVTGSNRRCSAQ